MVQAGSATDAVIETLLPLLDEGDIVIDGGNAKWTDTIDREKITGNESAFRRVRCQRRGRGSALWSFAHARMLGGSLEANRAHLAGNLRQKWTRIAENHLKGRPLENQSKGACLAQLTSEPTVPGIM